MSTPTPEDFFGEHPPARIFGTEGECNIQLLDPHDSTQERYVTPRAIKAAGYVSVGYYLDVGSKIYVDQRHLEICSAEALGPKQAAAVDAAGPTILSRVVKASGIKHNGLHRHSGTIFHGTERTSGYHENYMFPRDVMFSTLIDSVIASHLTSRIYAMAGTVKNGFQLSQKVEGIGGDPIIDRKAERYTKHGSKPMAMIRPIDKDTDVTGAPEWARLEVRFADPGFSLTARFLNFAATSLAMRIVEHEDMVDVDKLQGISFKYPANTAKHFSEDLTLSVTGETNDGMQASAVDFQDALLEEVTKLAEKIELPEDELQAIPLWMHVNDSLRAANLDKGEYSHLLEIVDFAIRHRELTRHYPPEQLNSYNNAVFEELADWDRLMPDGRGILFWKAIGSPYVSQEDVEHFANNPPLTRAMARGGQIKRRARQLQDVSWSRIYPKTGKSIPLHDSYAIAV